MNRSLLALALSLAAAVAGAYYVEGPTGAPECGARLTVTFLYPKR